MKDIDNLYNISTLIPKNRVGMIDLNLQIFFSTSSNGNILHVGIGTFCFVRQIKNFGHFTTHINLFEQIVIY